MFLDEYSFDKKVSSFMSGVYGWMCAALAVTASVAYYIAITPDAFAFVMQPSVALSLLFGQLLFVLALAFFVNRMSFVTALVLFLLYAASLGVTLSSIFYVYTQASIISTFLTTALMFGVMSLYGYITRSDLTTMGNLSFMALVGLVIGMVVNMFLGSAQFNYILSVVGVIVFVLLTAYDTQKIKQTAKMLFMNNQPTQNVTIIGALTLYLDFINIFLFLLNLFGKKEE